MGRGRKIISLIPGMSACHPGGLGESDITTLIRSKWGPYSSWKGPPAARRNGLESSREDSWGHLLGPACHVALWTERGEMPATTSSDTLGSCGPEAAPPSDPDGWEPMPRHTHAVPDQESVIDPQQPRALNLSRFTTNQHVNTILVAQSCTILQTKYYSRQWELYPHQPLLLGIRTHSWCPLRHVTNAVYGGRESSPTKGKTGTVPTQVSVLAQGSCPVLPAPWA